MAGEDKHIVLIAGGADKNIDSSKLADAIVAHAKLVLLTPGSGTDRLLLELTSRGFADVVVVENLAQAVEEAKLAAAAPDCILFSPAFASFAQYKNEYERNDEFMSLMATHEQE